MPNNINSRPGEVSGAPADDYVPVTKADNDLPDGPCRGLLVETAGTVNLMTLGGDIRANVPVFVGINPLACKRVLTGGTAAEW